MRRILVTIVHGLEIVLLNYTLCSWCIVSVDRLELNMGSV